MRPASAKLSSALLIADVNDFLSPSQTCILPMEGAAVSTTNPEPQGSVLAPIVSKPTEDDAKQKASITLSDCLSCSGCVTSAETVLLSTTHLDRLREARLNASVESRAKYYAIAALSQQSIAALAVHYGLSLDSCARKVAAFLCKHCHFDDVACLSRARALTHAESAAEFIAHWKQRTDRSPLVCSACPGWLTYAEKTLEPNLLKVVAKVRSPQAAFAAWVAALPRNRPPWIATVMPCHDKKIEAARPEYIRPSGPEVQCVLTASELLALVDELEYDLLNGPERPLLDDFALRPGVFGSSLGSGSGGHAEYVLHLAAKRILGIELERIDWVKASRSGDMRSVVVEHYGQTLRFACAYGFRSLQSLLRKIRRGTCEFDYIELMACPGGCNNGGGQIPAVLPEDGDAKRIKAAGAELLGRVEDAYFQAPNVTVEESEKRVEDVYRDVVGDECASTSAMELLHTKVVARKTSVTASLAW